MKRHIFPACLFIIVGILFINNRLAYPESEVSPGVKDGNNVPWTNIMPSETNDGMFLSKDGRAYYLGENVLILKRFEGIKVSPKSKKNGYITIIAWDYDKGGIDLFIMDSKTKKVIAKTNYWVDKRMLGGFAEWVSWSPREAFALVSPGGEGIRELSVIDIRTGGNLDIKIKRFENKYKGNIKEMQIVDIKGVSWKTDAKFSVPINIYCNPYEDDSCNGDLKIRRIIEANIDLKNIGNIVYTKKAQGN